MTDLAAESQTDRIVRLALVAGRLRRDLRAMVDLFESLPPEVQAAARALANPDRGGRDGGETEREGL